MKVQILKVTSAFLFLTLNLCANSKAQVDIFMPDTMASAAFANTMELYNNKIRRSSNLYNGSKYYTERYKTVKGHPYFASEFSEIGKLVYKGQLHWDIDMQYNIHQDILVIVHYDERGYYTELEINDDEVSWFKLSDHVFIRLIPDSINRKTLPKGYYNLVYQGKSEALIRHQKTIEVKESNSYRREFFKEKSRLYVKVDGIYHLIKGKRSIIKALERHEKEIKSFLRKGNIDFTNNAMAAAITTLKYFDSLDLQN